MSHFRETPLYSGLELVTVTNMVVRPQDLFPFHNMPGVDRDGETVKVFDLKEELGGQYFVIFFFPMDLMDLTVDSEEVRSLQAMVETFAVEGCQVTPSPLPWPGRRRDGRQPPGHQQVDQQEFWWRPWVPPPL